MMALRTHELAALAAVCIMMACLARTTCSAEGGTLLRVRIPQGFDPADARILVKQAGANPFNCPMQRKPETDEHRLELRPGTVSVSLAIYYPGYKLSVAELSASEISQSQPYTPTLEKLRSTPLTVRLTGSDGAPVVGQELVLRQEAIPLGFCPGGSGCISPTQPVVSAKTDRCGTIRVDVPVLLDDPALYRYEAYKPVFTVSLGDERHWAMPERVLRPQRIESREKYEEPVHITLLRAGKISGVLKQSFLDEHGLAANVAGESASGVPSYRFYMSVTDRASKQRITVSIRADGAFSLTLPPATYDLSIEASPTGSKAPRTSRQEISVCKDYSLREGEESTMVVE